MKDLKRGAFDFLAKRADWSLTGEVARALGVSRVTIVQYLTELLGQGLVERKHLGRASFWRARQVASHASSVVLREEAHEHMQQLYAERDAYLRMRSRLLGDSKYEGKFVAVLKGRVIDADFDERQLVRRMYAKYGYVVAFVEKVQTRKKVLEVPSPELGR